MLRRHGQPLCDIVVRERLRKIDELDKQPALGSAKDLVSQRLFFVLANESARINALSSGAEDCQKQFTDPGSPSAETGAKSRNRRYGARWFHKGYSKPLLRVRINIHQPLDNRKQLLCPVDLSEAPGDLLIRGQVAQLARVDEGVDALAGGEVGHCENVHQSWQLVQFTLKGLLL